MKWTDYEHFRSDYTNSFEVPTSVKEELSPGVNNSTAYAFQYIFMLWHPPINSWIDNQD